MPHDFDEGMIVAGLVEYDGASVSTIEDMVIVSANRTASRPGHKPPGVRETKASPNHPRLSILRRQLATSLHR